MQTYTRTRATRTARHTRIKPPPDTSEIHARTFAGIQSLAHTYTHSPSERSAGQTNRWIDGCLNRTKPIWGPTHRHTHTHRDGERQKSRRQKLVCFRPLRPAEEVFVGLRYACFTDTPRHANVFTGMLLSSSSSASSSSAQPRSSSSSRCCR